MQNQRRNKLPGEETAGKPPQEPPSPHKLQCFQDILDIVFSLSDEEWRTLSSDVPKTESKLQFASLCTKIVTSVCRSALQSYLPTLIGVVGMEAVLKAEEKLEKKAESASMSSSTNAAPSSDHSAKSSPEDPSDLICMIVEEFVSEVKTAMQRSICKVASYKASSWSKDWETTCDLVAKEMMNILETKVKPSHHEDTPVLRETQDKTKLHTEALTRKVIMVVIDVLRGSSAGRPDRKSSDLLITAAEEFKQMTSSSISEERLSMHQQKHKAQLPHEELRVKATRAVSQVLLSSTGVWERNSRSPEMPSSLASDTDLDSMLEAMAEAGFPNDLIQRHLDSTSRDIVSTIESSMDMLSSTSRSSKKKNTKVSGVSSIMDNTFHRIHERVKVFFRVMKKLVMERTAEPSSNVTQASETLVAKPVHRAESQAPSVNNDFQRDDLTVSCTNDVIGGIVQLYHSDVSHSEMLHGVMQELEKTVLSSRCSSKKTQKFRDVEDSNDNLLPKSVTVSEGNDESEFCSPSHPTESLFSDHFHEKAKQAVSDALLRTVSSAGSVHSIKTSSDVTSQSDLHITSDTSLPSSILVESAATDITETFMKDLKRMSSNKVDFGSMSEPTASTKSFRSAAFRLYRNVHYKVFGFLLRLQESHSTEEESIQHNTTSTLLETSSERLKPTESLQSDLHITSDTSLPSSILVKSAATDITETFMKDLKRMSSYQVDFGSMSEPTASTKSFRSAAFRLYRNVHHKVFGFLLRLQESHSAEESIQHNTTSTLLETNSQSTDALQSDDSKIPPRKQVDIELCTHEIIDSILDLYKREVQLVESGSTEEHAVSKSASLPPNDQRDHSVLEIQNIDEVISSDSVPIVNQPEAKTSTVTSERFLHKAIQVVNDVLLKSASQKDSCCTLSQTHSFTGSCSSSRDLHSAAVTIAETVVDSLDRYVESKHSEMTTVNSSSDMLSCLDVLSQISITNIPEETDTLKKKTYSNPFFIFRKVKDLLNDLLMGEQRSDPSVTATKTEHSSLGMSQATPIISHHSVSPTDSKTGFSQPSAEHCPTPSSA